MWPFGKNAPQLPCVSDIVDSTFYAHPKDCIFADGARDRIIAKCVNVHGKSELIDALEAAFKAEEIYCPHEGIDRRAEFGLIPRDFCIYMGSV